MTKQNPLVRKAGPLPVWAWAALVLVAGYVYVHRAPSAQGGAQLPFTPSSTGSAAQAPASGQGSAADNGSSDLLDALGNNLASQDALLAALQATGGGYGAAGGTGSTGGANPGGSDTSAVTAATVDSGTNNAPVDSSQPVYASDVPVPAGNTNDAGQVIVNVSSSGLVTDAQTGAPILEHGAGTITTDQSDAVSRYLNNTVGDAISPSTYSVTSPTPTVVQPAPVDTGGVIAPPPPIVRNGQAIAF